jgi:hypothetical protein
MNDYDTLYDSENGDSLLAEDLGITPEQYDALCVESAECGQPEGHIRPEILGGRRVYAAD